MVLNAETLFVKARCWAVIAAITGLTKVRNRLETDPVIDTVRTGLGTVRIQTGTTAELTQFTIQLFGAAGPFHAGLITTHLSC